MLKYCCRDGKNVYDRQIQLNPFALLYLGLHFNILCFTLSLAIQLIEARKSFALK